MRKSKQKYLQLILLLFGVIYSFSSSAQNYNSAIQSILNTSKGKERSELLYEYGSTLKRQDTLARFQAAEALLEHATKTNDRVGSSYAHSLFVSYYNNMHDYGNVLHHSMIAMNQQCSDTLEACIKIRRTISKILGNIGQTEDALKHQFKILDYYKSRKEYSQISKTCMAIGKLYIDKDEVESGLIYYHKSITSLQKSPKKKAIRNAYNTVGLVFTGLERYDSALFYFQKGLDVYKEHPFTSSQDSFTYGLISGNMGNIHFKLGNHTKALELIQIDKEFNMSQGGNISAFNACILIARIELKKNNTQQSLDNLIQAENILAKRNYALGRSLILYKGYVDTYHALRNFEKSDYYYKQYSELNDSIQKASSTKQKKMQLAFIDEIMKREIEMNKIASEKREQEIFNLEQKEAISQYKIFTLAGIFVIIIAFAIFFFLRFRSNVKKKQEMNLIKSQLIKAELINKELEQSLLQEELGVKNNQLTNLALDISRKHDFTDSLMDRLKKLRRKSTPEMVSEVNDLMIYARNELNIDKSLHDLQENIAKINYAFFDNLEKKHPELTKTEKYICGLLRLELSNNEIAILREVTVDSVKVSKNRLRRKMSLEQRTNLTKYLRSL